MLSNRRRRNPLAEVARGGPAIRLPRTRPWELLKCVARHWPDNEKSRYRLPAITTARPIEPWASSLRPRRGGGLNGPYRLNTTTFFADGVVNTLTAGSGRNWFFLQKKDKANPTPTDQVTFI